MNQVKKLIKNIEENGTLEEFNNLLEEGDEGTERWI